VLASQAAATHLREGGRIISTGSCLADRVVEPGATLYAMSKAALIGFTKGLARDLGPRGITVNIVHPGSTDTDMNPAARLRADAQRAKMAIPRYWHAGGYRRARRLSFQRGGALRHRRRLRHRRWRQHVMAGRGGG
jgi:NAD(P)-dependent dehydrogenase (short-subunit alcohol dehydrogenase family)